MEENRNNNRKNNKKKKGGSPISLTWIYVIIAFTLGYMLLSGDSSLLSGSTSRNATYRECTNYVEPGEASGIIVNKKEG